MREVGFTPEAQSDLYRLEDYIAGRSGAERASAYVDRVYAYCQSFAHFAERGTMRNDIRPGLRLIGFERRITIAFHVTDEFVVIDRILYGGRDLPAALAEIR